jgi:predicted nucleotidyltransferase
LTTLIAGVVSFTAIAFTRNHPLPLPFLWTDKRFIADALTGVTHLGNLREKIDSLRPYEELIAEATRRRGARRQSDLVRSRARGGAGPDSDLELLAIEPEVKSGRVKFVRLREALGNLRVPIYLAVVTELHVDEWGRFEGTMINDALREGRVLVPAQPV